MNTSAFVDCAGDLPRELRGQAAHWQSCVFTDHDGPLSGQWRIEEVARATAQRMTSGQGPITDVYVMCTHGMNRSGLVSGLILRELGFGGRDAIELIADARPGALSNMWFRRLIAEAGLD